MVGYYERRPLIFTCTKVDIRITSVTSGNRTLGTIDGLDVSCPETDVSDNQLTTRASEKALEWRT